MVGVCFFPCIFLLLRNRALFAKCRNPAGSFPALVRVVLASMKIPARDDELAEHGVEVHQPFCQQVHDRAGALELAINPQ